MVGEIINIDLDLKYQLMICFKRYVRLMKKSPISSPIQIELDQKGEVFRLKADNRKANKGQMEANI